MVWILSMVMGILFEPYATENEPGQTGGVKGPPKWDEEAVHTSICKE